MTPSAPQESYRAGVGLRDGAVGTLYLSKSDIYGGMARARAPDRVVRWPKNIYAINPPIAKGSANRHVI